MHSYGLHRLNVSDSDSKHINTHMHTHVHRYWTAWICLIQAPKITVSVCIYVLYTYAQGLFGLNVSDPDYKDYGFDKFPLTVNISCMWVHILYMCLHAYMHTYILTVLTSFRLQSSQHIMHACTHTAHIHTYIYVFLFTVNISCMLLHILDMYMHSWFKRFAAHC
jgi:hypothetical protein